MEDVRVGTYLTKDNCDSSSQNIIDGKGSKGQRHSVCAVIANAKGNDTPDGLAIEISCSHCEIGKEQEAVHESFQGANH